jgi:integrase/recombinase XerD
LKLFCPKCGSRLSKSHQYCPGCGSQIDKVLTGAKEHRRIRTLPIDEDTTRMFEEYISRGGPVTRGDRKLIFGINRHRGWQIIKGLASKAGLPELVNLETGKIHSISPHKLRDAFAIQAMKLDDSGDGLRLLQEHLGHASFNTTAKYRKVSGEEQRDWYSRLWEKGKQENG